MSDILLEGDNDVGSSVSDAQLHWDSWDWRYTLRALPQVIETTAPLPQETLHHNGSATYIDRSSFNLCFALSLKKKKDKFDEISESIFIVFLSLMSRKYE